MLVSKTETSSQCSLSLKTGLTFCWRCNKGRNNKGSFLGWARALGYQFSSPGTGSYTPLRRLLNHNDRADKSVVPIIQKIDLPIGFTSIAREPSSYYTKLITEMARRKNLDYEDFARAGAGFTMDSARWEPYCIFPVIDYGITTYYQGRTYIDVPGEPIKRFPSRSEVEYGASFWVYNIDEVREKKAPVVVIVESILNVLSLKRKFAELGIKKLVPVCVFKHSVSKVQAVKLLRCRGIREVCFLFDHDAIAQTWKAAELFYNRVRVRVAEMPYRADNPTLDPNDDVDAAIAALEDRKPYTATSALKQRAHAQSTSLDFHATLLPNKPACLISQSRCGALGLRNVAGSCSSELI